MTMPQSVRASALAGHLLIALSVLGYAAVLYYTFANPFSSLAAKLGTIAPALVFSFTLMGKACAIEAAKQTGQHGPLMSSFNLDILGLFISVVLAGLRMAGVLPPGLLTLLGLISLCAGLGSIFYFFKYLGGTAQNFGDEQLAALPGKIFKGILLFVALLFFGIPGSLMGLGPLIFLALKLLAVSLCLGYTWLLVGTALHVYRAV